MRRNGASTVPAAPSGSRAASPKVACHPEMRAHHRTDRVRAESQLMLGALAHAARKALTAAVAVLDQGARLSPPSPAAT